jgi:hypothetical protein
MIVPAPSVNAVTKTPSLRAPSRTDAALHGPTAERLTDSRIERMK